MSTLNNNAITPKPATNAEAMAAAVALRQFIGDAQMTAMIRGARGEERQHFRDTFVCMAGIVQATPVTYAQDGLGDQAIAYLHYFTGAWDWYVTEKDWYPDDEGQQQAFGLVRGHETELGYISIPELLRNGAELDLHFTPKTLAEVKARG